jgi:hypothetical protein
MLFDAWYAQPRHDFQGSPTQIDPCGAEGCQSKASDVMFRVSPRESNLRQTEVQRSNGPASLSGSCTETLRADIRRFRIRGGRQSLRKKNSPKRQQHERLVDGS